MIKHERYKDYIVLEDDNILNLCAKVDEYLNGGLIPIGGIAVMYDRNGRPRYYQALAREYLV